MDIPIRLWVASVVEAAQLADLDTLEMGSYDVNGSIRSCFTGRYVGIDIAPGPGVDLVANAHRVPFLDASFDVVVCCEMLEHDSAFWLSMAEAGRVLRPGGHLIVTTRSNGFKEHSHPEDYWRFMPDSAAVLASLASCLLVYSAHRQRSRGLFLHGVRMADQRYAGLTAMCISSDTERSGCRL